MIHENNCCNDEIRQLVLSKQPTDSEAEKLELFFKVFGDKTRLKILLALSVSELCVGHICEMFNLKQSTVSQHMKQLRLARLVKTRQAGKFIYYSLDDSHINGILQMGFDHMREQR